MNTKNNKTNNTTSTVMWNGGISKITNISSYYGFTTIAPIEKRKTDIVKEIIETEAWENKEEMGYISNKMLSSRISLLKRIFVNHGKLTSPLHFCEISKTDKLREVSINLGIIGSSKPINDSLVIFSLYIILQELGYKKNVTLYLNSIGDKETINQFTRDVTNYFRKHINSLCPRCRQIFKREPLGPISDCGDKECREIKIEAPKSIDYLSEEARLHFREVMETVESLGIPYEVDTSLIDNRLASSNTIFEFREKNEKGFDRIICKGGRFDGLSKKIGLPKRIPGVSGIILTKNAPSLGKIIKKVPDVKKPFLFLVQIGNEARIKSLSTLETLRKAKINVSHNITKENLGVQLIMAEKAGAKFAIIIGQREVIEKSVIIRNIENRSQSNVPLNDLINKIKELKS